MHTKSAVVVVDVVVATLMYRLYRSLPLSSLLLRTASFDSFKDEDANHRQEGFLF